MLTVKKQKQTSDTIKKITIIFGYSLFALIILNVLLSTVIPWSTLYFSPRVNKLNAIIFAVSLAAGVILPTLISYILGDKATHIKNKTSHHFNGVLFGVAAYWVSLFFSIVGTYAVPAIIEIFSTNAIATVLNGTIIIFTSIIMAIVAFSYARHQKNKTSVLQHAPYQWVLFGSVIAIFLLSIVTQVISDWNYLVGSLFPLIITFIAVLISYKLLRNQPSGRVRMATAITATTFGVVALSIASQVMSSIFYVGQPIFPIYVTTAFSLVVWISYLLLVTRKK